MSESQQVPRPIDIEQVLAQFRHATELLFRRRLPEGETALGVESAMPGVLVSESSWAEWEALLNGEDEAARGQ